MPTSSMKHHDHSSPGSSERISGCSSAERVRFRVFGGRVVAAADVPALQADPQVQPDAAFAQAVLAPCDLGRQLRDGDRVEVGAARHAPQDDTRRTRDAARRLPARAAAGRHTAAAALGSQDNAATGLLGAHGAGVGLRTQRAARARAQRVGGHASARARRADAQARDDRAASSRRDVACARRRAAEDAVEHVAAGRAGRSEVPGADLASRDPCPPPSRRRACRPPALLAGSAGWSSSAPPAGRARRSARAGPRLTSGPRCAGPGSAGCAHSGLTQTETAFEWSPEEGRWRPTSWRPSGAGGVMNLPWAGICLTSTWQPEALSAWRAIERLTPTTSGTMQSRPGSALTAAGSAAPVATAAIANGSADLCGRCKTAFIAVCAEMRRVDNINRGCPF